MCGIAGIIKTNNRVNDTIIYKMLNAIEHRGPDGKDVYINNNVGFGHVLLKIQDVTNLSKQPYIYKNWVLTYNGEIYNYKELRNILIKNNYKFKTDGDTEVLIKLIDFFGIKKSINKLEGSFAFAAYNIKSKKTYLVRDRFGIKPLYYYKDLNKIIFCSEIKGILQDNTVQRKVNFDKILESFNTRLWLSRETTFFQNIYCLKPGTYMVISNNNNINIKVETYYHLKFTNKYKDINSVLYDFGRELKNSVESKLISKVPVAAFLSGGLDSSIVCKLMQDKMKKPLSTYTIHYDFDNDLDLNHANVIAKQEKFNKHNVLIKENMYSIENIDKVTYGVEELLIDKVYIPMYFNYKSAKNDGYTVVVSGQGSDEVWLGYIFTYKIFEYINEKYNNGYLLNDYYLKNMIFSDKLKKTYFNEAKKVMKKYLENNLEKNDKDEINSYGDLSLKTILHDLLIQEDKIAMMNSVESRVPFVDNHRIVEIAYNTASNLKLYDGREKYIVRKYSKNKIDDSIINRKKFPFPEPPKIYNEQITNLCRKNWKEIKKSRILNKILQKGQMDNVNNFTELEQWWIIICWRFENIFKMEV